MIPHHSIDGYVTEGWAVNEDDWYDFDEDGENKDDGCLEENLSDEDE